MKSFFVALAFVALIPHDYFVSVLTLRHSPAEEALHLTWRMTTHDIEHTLLPESGDRNLHLGGEQELATADSLVAGYLLRHLRLEMDGKPLTVRYLGKEVEGEDMYAYLQVDGVKELRPLTVECTLLFDLFEEQENIVHVETGQGVLSHSFRNTGGPHTFEHHP